MAIVKIKFLEKYFGVLDYDLFMNMQKASLQGYNLIEVPQYRLDDMELRLKINIEKEKLLNKCCELNNKGIAYEKSGKIDLAIKTYEANIELGYPATHSFDRLIILYRKQKDYVNELRVIEIAIRVFMKENERRAEFVIDQYPEYKEDVLRALETNEKIKNDSGKYIFVQYNVMNYISRTEKVKILIKKATG